MSGFRLGASLVMVDVGDLDVECRACDACLIDPDDVVTDNFGDVCCVFCGSNDLEAYTRYYAPRFRGVGIGAVRK